MANTPTFLDPPIGRTTDSLPVRTATADVINYTLVQTHIADALERGRYEGATDPTTYLHAKQCLVAVGDESYATLAGILCFGHNPQNIFPRAVADIGHYRERDVVSSEVVHLEPNIGGTIFDQLKRLETYLWRNIHHGMGEDLHSLQRTEIHQYPRLVLRELLVNMLAHRDYANFLSAARIQIFRDRIEWVTPGGLPPGVTIDNILTSQVSRNPTILSVLYEAGYVEQFGQGLDTVVTILAREGMDAPQFSDTGNNFIVTVTGRPLEDLGMRHIQHAHLSEDQWRVLQFIQNESTSESATKWVRKSRIEEAFPDISERTLQRILRQLYKKEGLLDRQGGGPATAYTPTTESRH